ncbi:MAG: DUF3566 domain-containing protein [Actinomycetota bacterium]
MSDLPDLDDATFKLATGEELVLPGDDLAPAAAASANGAGPQPETPAGLAPVAPRPVARPTWRDKRTAGRLRARKVRRLVRHVEPWSVLKVALIFYFCLWVILLIAGVMLWSLAVSSGTVDNVETFITELFALESFTFNADQIFRASAVGGLVLVVAGAGFTVLMAVLFNLISDVTGGVRFTVVEEETARPRPKRLRPRRGFIGGLTGGQPQPVPQPPPGLEFEPGLEPQHGTAPLPGAAPMAEPELASMPFDEGFAPEEPAMETNVIGDEIPILATAESTSAPEISEGENGVVNEDDDR